jgi:hypothetical protein
MNREQIIETMARAHNASMAHAGDRELAMRRALSALEAAGLVVVPVEPTPAMQDGIWLAAQLQNANAQYTAMIKAAQEDKA